MNSRFSTNFVQVKLKEISNTAKILQRLQFCWIIHHSCEQSKNSQKNSQQTKSHIQYYSSQPRVFINTQFSTTIAIPSPVHYTTTINQNYSIFWSLTGTNFFQLTTYYSPLLFSNIIKILQEFGSDLLENFNNYTHCRFEPMTCA